MNFIRFCFYILIFHFLIFLILFSTLLLFGRSIFSSFQQVADEDKSRQKLLGSKGYNEDKKAWEDCTYLVYITDFNNKHNYANQHGEINFI